LNFLIENIQQLIIEYDFVKSREMLEALNQQILDYNIRYKSFSIITCKIHVSGKEHLSKGDNVCI